MIDRYAYDWKAEGDIDTVNRIPFLLFRIITEADELDWDMTLIMIHGDNDIIQATAQTRKYGIRGYGAFASDAFRTSSFNSWFDFFYFFFSKQSAFTTMRMCSAPESQQP